MLAPSRPASAISASALANVASVSKAVVPACNTQAVMIAIAPSLCLGPPGAGTGHPASIRGLTLCDISPKLLDLLGIKHIFPRRHIAFPVSYGINETCSGIARKLSQIDRPLRIAHTSAVTCRAMARE